MNSVPSQAKRVYAVLLEKIDWVNRDELVARVYGSDRLSSSRLAARVCELNKQLAPHNWKIIGEKVGVNGYKYKLVPM